MHLISVFVHSLHNSLWVVALINKYGSKSKEEARSKLHNGRNGSTFGRGGAE